MIYYIGIDPGMREAGVGILNGEGGFVTSKRLSNWTPHEFKDLIISIVDSNYDSDASDTYVIAAIEKVGAMPKQGISSTGKFMKATGIMIGILVGLEVPFVEVAPKKWRKISPTLATQKGESSTDKKKKSLEYIQNRYPEAKLTKQIEHNVADALCMAEWLYINRGSMVRRDDRDS